MGIITEDQAAPWHQRGILPAVNVAVAWSAMVFAISSLVQTTQYVGKLEQRVALNEQAIKQQTERDERQDRFSYQMQMMQSAQLEKLERKMDTIIDQHMVPIQRRQ